MSVDNACQLAHNGPVSSVPCVSPVPRGDLMPVAIGYVRVSTIGQAVDGVSLDAQKERIQAWATANGYELAGIHVDAGLSGKRADNRPGLAAALDAVCKSRGVLVVYSLSRMSRSTKDTLAIAERLQKSRAELVSLSERIDTTGAAGKMVFGMLAVLAQFERDVIAERTKTAMSHKRAKGERISRKIPYGFELAADGVALIEVPAEQKVLKLVAELRAAGESLRAIAAILTGQGIPTRDGGSTWKHSTIQGLLARAA